MNPGKRVTKTPEARRQEFMDAAERLFNVKGYDDTAVSDIVRELGVAQGTFYYHFESKEELRDAVVDRVADEVAREVAKATADGRMDALDKLFAVYGLFSKVMRGRERLSQYLHEERNAAIHERIERKVSPALRDSFEAIIIQGNREGLTDAPHPRMAAYALLGFSAEIGDQRHDHTEQLPEKAFDAEGVVAMVALILGAEQKEVMRRVRKMKRRQNR